VFRLLEPKAMIDANPIAPSPGRGSGSEARPVIEPSGRGCSPEPPHPRGTLALQGWEEVSEVVTGAASSAPRRGTLVIMGGRTPEEGLWEVLRATGRGRPRVGVIPTASSDPIAAGMDYVKLLRDMGAEAVLVEITEANCGSSANDPVMAELVRSLDAVFFVGGDQNRVTRCLLLDGRPTQVLKALWDLYVGGGVISGNSAGAAIMSDPMIGGGMDERVEITQGLGFLLPGRVIVDQHFLARGRFIRLLEAMLRTGVSLGLGIDEDTAVVCSDGVCRVVGRSAAVLLRYVGAVGGTYRFWVDYLTAGDISNLSTGEVVVASGKRLEASGPLASSPAVAEDVDIKSRDGVVRALDALLRYSPVTLKTVTSESGRVTYAITLTREGSTAIYRNESGAIDPARYTATGCFVVVD